MTLFTGFFLYIILCIATAMLLVFAPFGAIMLATSMGHHPIIGCVGAFLIMFSYVFVAEKLGHLDDLHL